MGAIIFVGVVIGIVIFIAKKSNDKPKISSPQKEVEKPPLKTSRLLYGVNPLSDISKPCPDSLKKPLESTVKIEFFENKTKDFQSIIDLVKEEPSFLHIEQKFIVSYSFGEWEKIKKVFDIVKKWNKTVVYINDEISDNATLAKVFKCLVDKEKSHEENWCDRLDKNEGNMPSSLGCRRLDVGYGFYGRAWYDYLMLEDNRFKIDKEAILTQLVALGKTCKHCPYFNSQKIWENYLKIPPTISFNDVRFLCLKWKDGHFEAWPRFAGQSIKDALFSNFDGTVLSQK